MDTEILHLEIHGKTVLTSFEEAPDTAEERRKFYKENGFIIFRELIPKESCESLIDLFEAEVKPFKGKLKRFSKTHDKRNKFDEYGRVTNAVLIRSALSNAKIRNFANKGFELVYSSKVMKELEELVEGVWMGGSMTYFEISPYTNAHQDTPLIKKKSDILTTWIALEDIHPLAGGIYICPKTHGLDFRREISVEHVITIEEYLENSDVEIYAPTLKTGDVLVFDGYTVHGSIPIADPSLTRHSINGRYQF